MKTQINQGNHQGTSIENALTTVQLFFGGLTSQSSQREGVRQNHCYPEFSNCPEPRKTEAISFISRDQIDLPDQKTEPGVLNL